MKKEEIATLVKYRMEQAQVALADARRRASLRRVFLLKLFRNTYKVFSLALIGRMLKIPCYQIVRDPERAEAFPDDCFLLPAASFLMLAG